MPLRPLLAGLIWALGILAGAQAAPPPTQLAWLRDGTLSAAQRDARRPVDAGGWHTPLGSSWKLFMYSYLHANAVQEPAYRCQRPPQPDDEYCCDPGESITRDAALARSCGPYFDPQRLGVDNAAWSRFWMAQQAPAWLLRLDALQPDTSVAVPELLQALQRIPAPQKSAVREALMPLALRDADVTSALGSGPRYKTWSWNVQGVRAGGAIGWLLDGTAFWFGAAGTSKTALAAQADWIASQWPATALPDAAAVSAQSCVEVQFFERYPIQSVLRADGSEAPSGALRGRHRIHFVQGTRLVVDAVPALTLQRDAQGSPRISARLGLEDYVARVLDREGDATQAQAARALAVAARSYVLQNGTPADGCLRIADATRHQRVSPQPPTTAARAAAAFTDGLVLQGAEVRYHGTRASPGVLSWQQAVDDGRGGMRFDEMLRRAYPGAALGTVYGGTTCDALPQATQWLAARQQRWRALLRAQPGFEPVGDALRVCRLHTGTPHSDQRRLVIRVREWQTREGRVTLIHEFLHLAYRKHPLGRDEAAIERLAQRLADS